MHWHGLKPPTWCWFWTFSEGDLVHIKVSCYLCSSWDNLVESRKLYAIGCHLCWAYFYKYHSTFLPLQQFSSCLLVHILSYRNSVHLVFKWFSVMFFFLLLRCKCHEKRWAYYLPTLPSFFGGEVVFYQENIMRDIHPQKGVWTTVVSSIHLFFYSM